MAKSCRWTRGIHAAVCIGLTLLAGCGPDNGAKAQPEWKAGGDTNQVAASIGERIETLLTQNDIDESQKTMLKRALSNDGVVTRSDYLTAWDNYRQCMVGRGYTPPPMPTIDDLYIRQQKIDPSGMSAEQNSKFEQDSMDCHHRYVLAVDEIYRENMANPNMYRDPATAVVDCLHRNNLVARDYTVRQYMKAWDSLSDEKGAPAADEREVYERWRARFGLDFGNPKVRTCVAANDSNLFGDKLEAWKPLS